jgi:hypothetical protein
MKVLDKDMRVKILYINSKASCVVCGYQQPHFFVGRNSGVMLKCHVVSWRYSSNLHNMITFVKWMNKALSLVPP